MRSSSSCSLCEAKFQQAAVLKVQVNPDGWTSSAVVAAALLLLP
jgi:hypothetical protein